MTNQHYQQQDLDWIKDTLQFGHALLHISNYELRVESDKQLYKLKEILDSQHPCGGKDWVKVVDVDMARPSQQCPPGWQETGYSKRTCGRINRADGTCDAATFPVTDYLESYNQVCGRIVAYQFGGPDAFTAFDRDNKLQLTDSYVDGIVLYYGTTQPQHIWTFAVGTSEVRESPIPNRNFCPCDCDATNIDIPDFVGSDYFCESQNLIWPNFGSKRFRLYSEDILWDGEDCLPTSNCCEFNRPPYFIKTLPEPTCEDIVASICFDNGARREDVAVEVVEIYVRNNY